MAAAFSATRNRQRVAAPAPQDDGELNEAEEALLKLTSVIPDEKDWEKDMELGMFMIDG
jgi:hypothetical protein